VLKEGITSLIQPIIENYTMEIKKVEEKQNKLTNHLNNLYKEIFEASKHTEFINFEPKLTKLSNIKKTSLQINHSLINISERITKMEKEAIKKYPETYKLLQHKKQLEKGIIKEKKEENMDNSKEQLLIPKDQFVPDIISFDSKYKSLIHINDKINV
jgi:hypothetical protein